MKRQKGNILLCLIIGIFIQASTDILGQNAPKFSGSIKVGDKAPPLKIAKWIKGSEVNEFRKDHIYLVEFGFITCGPCRISIPILSAINCSYPDQVTVVGIHIWENNKQDPSNLSYINRVADFIKAMGNKINYTIGVDVPEQTTADTWGGGAPKTFIIDRQGIVAWIGNPITSNVDSIIAQIVGGSFNAQRTAEQEQQIRKDIENTMAIIWSYKEGNHYDKALERMEQLLVKYPDQQWLGMNKFRLLDGMDEDNLRAMTQARWLLKNNKKGQVDLYKLAHAIIESKHPDYELAIEAIDSAMLTSDYDYTTAKMLEAKARAYFKKGDPKNGVKNMKLGIHLLKTYGKELEQEKKSMEILFENYIKKFCVTNAPS